jgi:16S rRNA (uracil1498-N3)-methyltransferase
MPGKTGTDKTGAGKTRARIYVDQAMAAEAPVALSREQTHYLLNVLRLGAGDTVTLFNGADGEWQARLEQPSRKTALAVCESQLRAQVNPADITYAFAPLKHARLDYIAQKAAEMGVAALQPVITERTIARKVNIERVRANLVEGAEQCGVLWVPEVHEPVSLERFLRDRPDPQNLIFCDEAAPSASPVETLKVIPPGPMAVLIGPEGGFTASEQARIRDASAAVPISLGPRIMRADTAAVAALALVQAINGDWQA